MPQLMRHVPTVSPPGSADYYVLAPTEDPDAFAMVVDGDCMEPDYRRGELVVFSPLEAQRHGPQDGKDYAVGLDGQAANESSFRRLFLNADDPSVFVLRCVNSKYPNAETIPRSRVVRLARAVWVSRPAAAHIDRDAGFRGGRARIKGTRITVDDIVIMHRHLGQSLEEIAGRYDLPPAAVHAAMTYYFDHREEIDQLLAADEALVDAFQRDNPSGLRERLKALGRG